MPASLRSHVLTWVFDLDHTLYPADSALFDQINTRMTAFVMRELGLARPEADELRHRYWRAHGTTLAGLMDNHGIEPGPYLEEVHDIDFSVLAPDPLLARGIGALPGRRIVYTNGSAPYAAKVIEARGLSGLFDAVYGVEHAGFRPKPERRAFDRVFGLDGFDPARAAMFEDDPRNLAVPHEMGMRTIHVAPEPEPQAGEHIHFHTDDLSDFVTRITG